MHETVEKAIHFYVRINKFSETCIKKLWQKSPVLILASNSKLNLPDIKTESFCFDQLYFNNQHKTHFRKKKSLTTKEDHFVSNSVTTKKKKN
jgi:hypothetical protein